MHASVSSCCFFFPPPSRSLWAASGGGFHYLINESCVATPTCGQSSSNSLLAKVIGQRSATVQSPVLPVRAGVAGIPSNLHRPRDLHTAAVCASNRAE